MDEVFAEEQPFLVPAPLLFDGYKETDVRISNTCLAMVDRNSYSVACLCAGKIVQCRSYADRLVFVYDGKEVGQHVRRFTRGETYYDWQHYLPLLIRKPGALRNGSPFAGMPLPDTLRAVQGHLQLRPHGRRDFAHILSYIPAESMESVVAACDMALQSGAVSKDVILNILLRRRGKSGIGEGEGEGEREGERIDVDDTEALSNLVTMKLKYMPTDDCSYYNQLLNGGV